MGKDSAGLEGRVFILETDCKYPKDTGVVLSCTVDGKQWRGQDQPEICFRV